MATPKQPKNPELPSLTLEPQSIIIARLRDLLQRIDPNCEYGDWLHVLMAIYHATGSSTEGLELADKWSSAGKTYKGTKEIHVKWRSFKSDTSNPITIATLVKMAKGNGLESHTDLDAFEPCETEVVEPAQEQSLPVEAVNPLSKYSLLDMSAEVEKQTVEQVPVMGKIALIHQNFTTSTWMTAVQAYL